MDISRITSLLKKKHPDYDYRTIHDMVLSSAHIISHKSGLPVETVFVKKPIEVFYDVKQRIFEERGFVVVDSKWTNVCRNIEDFNLEETTGENYDFVYKVLESVKLTDKEAFLVKAKFGVQIPLTDFYEKAYNDAPPYQKFDTAYIAKILNCSDSQVSSMTTKILKKLRSVCS